MSQLLQALLTLRQQVDAGENNLYAGICISVDEVMYINGVPMCDSTHARARRKEIFRTWPKFSGTLSYPVPSTNPELSAEACFHFTSDKWSGEYGQLRRELLDYLIEELSK